MTRCDIDKARDHIGGEAAEWFTRLQEPSPGTEAEADFADWLRRSPQHVKEYLTVSRVWGQLTPEASGAFTAEELVKAARRSDERSNVAEWPVSNVAMPGAESRRPLIRHWPLAAAAALGAVGLALLLFSYDIHVTRYSTASGETKTAQLPDGSTLHLNGNSSAKVTMSSTRRNIDLLEGEARFDVVKESARPFFVVTSRATVHALGTVFNVQASGSRTTVTVLDGRVEVIGSPESSPAATSAIERSALDNPRIGAPDSDRRVELAAGERAAVTSTGQVLAGAGPSVDEVRAWSERRLVFRDASLADVVAEFNRYNEGRMELADPSLAGLHISGTFDANDPASLLEYLQRYEGLQSMGSVNGRLKLSRRETASSVTR